MNSDYRTPTKYYSDVRTFMLKRRLGNDGLAALNFLWCWTAIHRANGILTGMNEEKIEVVSFWDGKPGDFIPALIELEYLDVLQDGTYALHEWAETNSWAADADNRSDKSRLSSMAKNYPELYENLVAQGATGIDKATYARLTAEHNSRGIVRSLSTFQRTASESLAPTPTQTPAPTPELEPDPEPTPTPESREAAEPEPAVPTATAQESSSYVEEKTTYSVDTDNTQATIPFENTDNPENLSSQSETNEPATIENVISQWNAQLGSLGFHKAKDITARRKSAFKARIRSSQSRSLLVWWVSLFAKIAASNFMCESAAQKANWLTVDWILNETNMNKVLEGKYDNDRPRKATIYRNFLGSSGTQSASTASTRSHFPTTIRRLTQEELSGPEVYRWEVEHGYGRGMRKQSTIIEAEVEASSPNNDTLVLEMPSAEAPSDAELSSEDLADIYECLDEYYAEKEAAKIAKANDSGEAVIPRIKGVWSI